MKRAASKIDKLVLAMISYYQGDARRIQHFLKVHSLARLIGRYEGLDEKTQFILEAAALVHDIGIKPAEELYGKGVCGGDLQQKLGVKPAAAVLGGLDFEKDEIDRICYLVAHHHTYKNIEGLDLQILIEADFLVNAYDDSLSSKAIESFKARVFKTKTGTELLRTMFCDKS